MTRENVSDSDKERETGITRRDFIKSSATTGIAAASVLGDGEQTAGILEALAVSKAHASDTGSKEEIFNAVCAPNCWMGCRLKAHVRDGKLVKTSMNPMPNPRYNRICLRGLSHVQRVYHPDRLKYPMRRAGKRGEGKWERISWDEAIDTITKELTRLRELYGSKAVAFIGGSGNYGIINGGIAGALPRFAGIFEGTLVTGGIDLAMPLGIAQVMASNLGGVGGWISGNDAAELSHARLVIVWGSNITESQVHNWHFVSDALNEGAKLVVIDPNYTTVASKADTWIRPRPGSDPALALSVIHTLIEEKLYDKEFVLNYTVGPFLVRGYDKMFLREENHRPDRRCLVWDRTEGKAIPFDEVQDPALFGRFTVNGREVTPAFQLLADEAARYIPEKAVSITEVPPDTVRALARQYATRKPASIYPGYGVDRWTNSHLLGRGLATMAALTGNLARPGATPAGAMGGAAIFLVMDPLVLSPWLFPKGTYYHSLNSLLFYEAVTKGEVEMYVPVNQADPTEGTTGPNPEKIPYPVKAAFINASNFISNYPHQNKIRQKLFSEANLEFIVVADMVHTDTTAYADILLPVTHWFENEDIVAGIHPFLLKQDKALENPYECKSDLEIFRLISEKLGLGKYFNQSPSEYIDEILTAIAKKLGRPSSNFLAEFKKTGAVQLFPGSYYAYEDKKFPTSTGRLEFYAEKVVVNFPLTVPALGIPVSMGVSPLPHFEPPVEAWPDNFLFKKYPLVCYQEHSRWRVHSQWFDVSWLRELDPEPVVKMNPEDAAARGIASGDYVEVFNDRGQVLLKALLSQGIRKGVVNIPKGWQRHQTRKGGYQELTADHKHPIHLNCSFFDTLVEVRKV